MTKRTSTLMNEAEALTREACRLVDLCDDLVQLGHAGTAMHVVCVEEVRAVRAKRDGLRTLIAARNPGSKKNYVSAWLYW